MPKLSLEGIVKFEPYQGGMDTYELEDGAEVSVDWYLFPWLEPINLVPWASPSTVLIYNPS